MGPKEQDEKIGPGCDGCPRLGECASYADDELTWCDEVDDEIEEYGRGSDGFERTGHDHHFEGR
jgi:hypothetical protein